MRVTVTAEVKKLCPYIGEDDFGTVEATFAVAEGDAPELHQLHRTLTHRGEGEAISHEDFTRWVAETTGAVRVVTRWTTAGMAVVCEIDT